MASDSVCPESLAGQTRRTRLRAIRYWGLAALLFSLPFVLAHAGWKLPSDCELVVEMQVGDSSNAETGSIEVWVNSTAGTPACQTAVRGIRRAYRFPLQGHREIHYLRIDPSNYPNVPVLVYGVRIARGEETLCAFTPADLAGWHTTCEQSALRGDALALRARHNDPLFDADFPAVVLPSGPENALLHYGLLLLSASRNKERMMLVLSVSTLVVLALGLRRGGRTAVAVVAVSVPLTYAALQWVGRLGGKPPSGAAAIGFALYNGYPKSREMEGLLLLLSIPTLVALLGIYLRRRLSKPAVTRPEGQATLPASRPRRWIGGIVLGLLTVGLAGYFVPDLASSCPTGDTPFTLHWDGNNCLVWQYLVQTGARPFRDFWYPYSGQILFLLPFPHGEMAFALHRVILFAVFLLAIYLNTAKSLPATLGLFGTLFGLYVGNFFAGAERYGVIVNLVLAHVALDPAAERLSWRHVLFWIAAVQAAVIEPAGVAYAGIPLLVSYGLDLLQDPAAFRTRIVGRMAREYGPPTIVLLAVGLYLTACGELVGFIDFFARLGSMSDYAAYPVELSAWLRLASPAESFLLWSFVFLIGVGLVRNLGQPGGASRADRSLLLLGLAGGMLMLKQFVRPHMAPQIFVVNVTGVLFYLFACRKANGWQWGGTVLAAGLLGVNLLQWAEPERVGKQVWTAVARARNSAPILAMKKHERQAVVARVFSPARFSFTETYGAVLRALIDLAQRGGIQPLFVLSDDPIFYILAGSRPYFHINGYNGSPIREQQHVVRLLEEKPPRVIVWRPGDAGVDAVPPVLRDALVYEHVIRNYVPDRSVPPSDFLLLRRRGPEEAVDVDFWRTHLGSVLHLGHIPRFSNRARFGPLTGKSGEEVAEFLTVRVTDPNAVTCASGVPELPPIGNYHPEGRTLAIPVECAGRRFTLALSIVPGQTEYHVLLNRVWFWGALRKAGLAPALGDAVPGVEMRIDRRALGDGILY
jgi:hypothetical protein